MVAGQDRRLCNHGSLWLVRSSVPFLILSYSQGLLFPGCLSPYTSLPLPREAPSLWWRCLRGRWWGSGESGKFWQIFFSQGRSLHHLSLRPTQVSLPGLGSQKWLRVMCSPHPPGLRKEEEGIRQAGAAKKKEFCPGHLWSPSAGESSVSRLSPS